MNAYCFTKNLARGGFDPPTFGLWAQHASPAPPRYEDKGKVCVYKAYYFIMRCLGIEHRTIEQKF